ncbi:MAG: DeoR/GlpR family DNA-binding transcription regulator [Bacilli bacterium]
MLPEERKFRICTLLNDFGKVNVVNLAEQFNVTTETIRRDLALLEREGILQRVYGGAVKTKYCAGEPAYFARQKIERTAKQSLAKAAAAQISTNETIFLDHGTTVEEMIPFLPIVGKNTYVTTSVPVAFALGKWIDAKGAQSEVIICGGEMNVAQFSVGGVHAADMLRQLYFDAAFLTVGGFAKEYGFTDYHHDESYITKLITERTKQCVVVADRTKLGVVAPYKVASFRQVDALITNAPLPVGWVEEVDRSGMQWVTIESEDTSCE